MRLTKKPSRGRVYRGRSFKTVHAHTYANPDNNLPAGRLDKVARLLQAPGHVLASTPDRNFPGRATSLHQTHASEACM